MSQINEFLEVHQLYKQRRQRPTFSPIAVYSVTINGRLIWLAFLNIQDGMWDMNICFVELTSLVGNHLLLRKSDTTDAMKLILDVQKAILIQSNNGTEFVNGNFQSLLQSKGVCHITVNVGNHSRHGLIERFNRTLEVSFHSIRSLEHEKIC